ncbi:hypothetical protein KUL25_21160 [Rhodobacteraceae bacterium N5(2021)]|uniref:asparagine synthase (glutamine-hydrolyzing) n=1 Tax=Gymnodinialimonas phycosphaerae TaxID=2841589 RepID=A0A975TWC0_9RHOB|nr:asparagine synthase-related protein [Gymnodinialimonas phycosphaerae]MBY4895279.1 hypothetical protein [Gymnodinialimonas phycosphaerae]
MSGIAAVFERNGTGAGPAIIEGIADALKPHGPEWSRTLVSGPAAFAYAHLTNTPQARADAQPLHHAPSDTVFLFDGRLDNREDLAKRLGMGAQEAGTLPDSAIAQACWLRWGQEALGHWVGDFAVLHWDARNRQITAAVDPFGRRCLSYHLTDTRLVIASMPKGVLAHPDIRRVVDRRKLAEAVGRMFVVQDETLFEGISRVPAGTILTVGPTKTQRDRFYDIEARIKPIRYRSDAEYVEAASELLSQSVQARLRSGGPVGSFLSGGLDSSSAAVEAAGQLMAAGKTLETFTSIPEAAWDGRLEAHVYGNETPFVEAIAARQPGITLNYVDCAGLKLSYGSGDYFRCSDTLFPAYNNAHWYAAIGQAAKAKGVTALLDGTFGNMTFSRRGDDLFIEQLMSGRLVHFAREFRARRKGSVPRSAKAIARHLANWAVLSRTPRVIRKARQRALGLRSADLLQSVVTSDVLDQFGSVARWEKRIGRTLGGPYQSSKDKWLVLLKHHQSALTGEMNQGFAAMHGIELRDPFADRRLVEWSLGVPADQFTRNGQTRWLITRMMANRLPDQVLYKDRYIGRQAPDWHLKFTRELDDVRAAVERAARHPLLSEMFDYPDLRSALDTWPGQTPITDGGGTFDGRALPLVHQAINFVEEQERR